jgi:hypothetical protein
VTVGMDATLGPSGRRPKEKAAVPAEVLLRLDLETLRAPIKAQCREHLAQKEKPARRPASQ